jgi:type IX secretion system PorP/SprF family membrane protein
MKKLSLLFFSFFVIGHIQAQVTTHYDLFQYNPSIYNPAMVGEDGVHKGTLMLNSRLMHNSLFFSYEHDFQKANSGIGLMVNREVLGNLLENLYSFNYNYKKAFGDGSYIRIGTNFNYFGQVIGGSLLGGNNDMMDSYHHFTAGIGMMYFKNNFKLGFSSTNMVFTRPIEQFLDRTVTRVYNGMIGYDGIVYSDVLSSDHILLYRRFPGFHQIQLANNFNITSIILAGLAYQRTFDQMQAFNSIVLSGGMKFNDAVSVILRLYAFEDRNVLSQGGFPFEGMLRVVF